MTTFALAADRLTLHGTFSIDRAPVLVIDPGDTVDFTTLISGWTVDPDGTKFRPRDPTTDRGHALVGPVYIRGARPGQVLAVQVDAVRTGRWGESGAGGGRWGLNEPLGLSESPHLRMRWVLDPDAQVGRSDIGHQVRLAPFLGVMGMPPPAPGLHSTIPPRIYGGNIDCRELVAGSTLYLPIGVEGGLFSVGDGHARQGDGEVGGIAIECPMERVSLTFRLLDNPELSSPWAETAIGTLTFGFDADLDTAALQALDAMLTLMGGRLGLTDRRQALALATAVVDLRITQMVNGVRGVHAVLPRDALLR